MTYEVVSTRSWNVLGTFEDEGIAREAVSSSLGDGASMHDLVVYVSDDEGHQVAEWSDQELAEWAGHPVHEPEHRPAASAW